MPLSLNGLTHWPLGYHIITDNTESWPNVAWLHIQVYTHIISPCTFNYHEKTTIWYTHPSNHWPAGTPYMHAMMDLRQHGDYRCPGTSPLATTMHAFYTMTIMLHESIEQNLTTPSFQWHSALQWRHNERDGVSNHWRLDCLLSRLFRRGSKNTSKLRVTGLCEGNAPVTDEFSSQRASDAANVSIR